MVLLWQGLIRVEIASETARAIRAAGFPGLYLITPLNRFDVIRGVLAGVQWSSLVVGGWKPGRLSAAGLMGALACLLAGR